MLWISRNTSWTIPLNRGGGAGLIHKLIADRDRTINTFFICFAVRLVGGSRKITVARTAEAMPVISW